MRNRFSTYIELARERRMEAVVTMDQVVGRLDAILADASAKRSRLGYFPALYRKMTVRVAQGIEDRFFDDNERMERLSVIFATRYLDALEQYQRGEAPTRAWALAFDTARQWWPIVTQHLALGINAHINLDLSIATVESVPDGELASVRDDYNRINDLLAGLLDEVQRELAGIWPAYRLLDIATGRADEHLLNFSLSTARDLAWSHAEHLLPLSREERQSAVDTLDRKVARLGQLIVHPGILLGATLKAVRLGERGGTAEHLRILS